MNADLENAKNSLENNDCTCVLCQGEHIYISRQRGVKPLLDFLDSDTDFTGFSAADKVVGKATAFLYSLLGVREVYAQVMSQAAAQMFTLCGIDCSCSQLVDTIRNRENTGPCPMEHATQDINNATQALAAIRKALEKLR